MMVKVQRNSNYIFLHFDSFGNYGILSVVVGNIEEEFVYFEKIVFTANNLKAGTIFLTVFLKIFVFELYFVVD